MAKENVRRVQMDLPERSYNRLVALKENMEATSYTDVLKSSLRALEFLVQVENDGGSFMIKGANGEVREIKIFT
jgi:hypothetical protein